MTYENIEKLQENRVFYHFFEISKIPRPSLFEKKISDFILNWAKNLNLEVHQDEKFNLLIRKAASPGNEKKKPIILQAHIDMVCQKSVGIEHSFETDPIKMVLDGDILSTGNRTTLGADDGIGVALAMTILEAKDLVHPPIDVIFTTAEEEDLSGALNVDKSWFNTNRIINIDHVVDSEQVAGSCGGIAVESKLKIDYIEVPKGYVSYKIKVDGLIGGHSGEDINRGRANANVLLGRLLNFFRDEFDYEISDINGGTWRTAIPRSSYVTIAFHLDNLEKFKKTFENFFKMVKKVYSKADKNITLEIEEVFSNTKMISKENFTKVIDMIFLSPNGISKMLGDLKVVESSCNLGEIHIKDGYIFIIIDIRAAFEENYRYIAKKIQLLAKNIGLESKTFTEYPSWHYKEDSELRNISSSVYSNMFGEKIKTLIVHAGLEPSCFSDKIVDMDAISIGPNTWDLHCPKERLSISSTEKIYKFLIKILESLP